jgi:hypothetical protein
MKVRNAMILAVNLMAWAANRLARICSPWDLEGW